MICLIVAITAAASTKANQTPFCAFVFSIKLQACCGMQPCNMHSSKSCSEVLNHVIACIWYLVGYLSMEAGGDLRL